VIQKYMRHKYEPASEPLHISYPELLGDLGLHVDYAVGRQHRPQHVEEHVHQGAVL